MLWLLLPLFIFGIIYSRFAGKLWWISLILVSLPFLAVLFLLVSVDSEPDSVCYGWEFMCSTTSSDRDLIFILLFFPALGVSTIGAILVYFLSRKSVRKDKMRSKTEISNPGATDFLIQKESEKKEEAHKNATVYGKEIIEQNTEDN